MCLAYPAKIIAIEGDDATVELAENQYKVKLVLLPEAQVGQYVLVHAGYAIQTIDAEAAKETWDILQQIKEKGMKDASKICQHIKDTAKQLSQTIRIMEVCGTHTVAIQRCGLRSLLPENIKLVSGPGCPVCVTPAGYIDSLIELARKDAIIVTYGDMVRVKGSQSSLAHERAAGRKIEVILSAFDGIKIAKENPSRHVVFAAVGFETTTPQTADVILRADREKLENFSVLASHKVIIPAMDALLSLPTCAIDGFLCPGHVSIMIGANAYKPIVQKYSKPCVIAGFEPFQILEAVDRIITQIAEKQSRVENLYPAVVKDHPLATADALVKKIFEPADTEWRALGTIPASGLDIRSQFEKYDAGKKFQIQVPILEDPPGCRCTDVIQGLIDPINCPLFGKLCTPLDPVGPCMVSSEGACQAWYKYG